VRGLEHLPGIEWMEVRIVISQAVGGLGQNLIQDRGRRSVRFRWVHGLILDGIRDRIECGKIRKLAAKPFCGAGKQSRNRINSHGDHSPYHTGAVRCTPFILKQFSMKELPNRDSTQEEFCTLFGEGMVHCPQR
jgi:hypothetical protein